jgi:hypothetical protein
MDLMGLDMRINLRDSILLCSRYQTENNFLFPVWVVFCHCALMLAFFQKGEEK